MSEEIDSIVVVGAGPAGATAAATLRAEGFTGAVTLIGTEPDLPYRRPAVTKEVLRGDRAPEQVRLRAETFWAEKGIDLRTGVTATDLDPGARTVLLDDGSTLRYHRLLLATGGRARALPGVEPVEGVHVLRSLADAAALRARLRPDASLVVVGAGFVGAEVAASARHLGCAVTLLEAAPVPLGRVLPPVLAEVYAGLHRENGVDLRLGTGLAGVRRDGAAVLATDSHGAEHRADALVLGIGMDPDTGLAERAGLAVQPGPTGGVLVDEFCRTSAPDVYAAGDVACHPGPHGAHRRIEHWQNALSQGAAAARAILGGTAPYADLPWCWSDQYGVNLQVCGEPTATDEVLLRGDPAARACTAVFARDGRLTGAIGINAAREIRTLRTLIAQHPHTPLTTLATPDLTTITPT